MPQTPSIILPQIWTVGTEVEIVADALTHVSVDIFTEHLEQKLVQILATEVVVVGVPGNLLCWIELSPVPQATSVAYCAAIGGGGGALAPVAPTVEVATGVNGIVHTILLPWIIHSPYARLVVQTPIPAAAAFWVVQAIVEAKKYTEGMA